MWMVAKIKVKELNIFKKELIEKFGSEIKFYYPKIEYQKYIKNKLKKFEKPILENYIFCYHVEFRKISIVNEIKYLRGLLYFLDGYNQNQNELIRFIEHCKRFENEKGFLTPAFFNAMEIRKAKFISGPFTNMIFEILDRKKNRLKILIGNIVTTISDKTNYLYYPI